MRRACAQVRYIELWRCLPEEIIEVAREQFVLVATRVSYLSAEKFSPGKCKFSNPPRSSRSPSCGHIKTHLRRRPKISPVKNMPHNSRLRNAADYPSQRDIPVAGIMSMPMRCPRFFASWTGIGKVAKIVSGLRRIAPNSKRRRYFWTGLVGNRSPLSPLLFAGPATNKGTRPTPNAGCADPEA